MHEIHFDSLDLNLLRVFDALFEEGTVHGAARRLNLSASAISHALNRLRYAFQDQLFVRHAAGMQPTERAAQVGLHIRHTLRQLRAGLGPSEFNAAETDRHFRIACTDYAATMLLPSAMAVVRSEARGVRMTVRPIGNDIVDEIDGGRVDLAIGNFGRLPERLSSEVLFSDRLVWVLRAAHPLATGPLTIRRLAAIPQLVIASGAVDAASADVVVERGLERYVARTDFPILQGSKRDAHRRIVLALTNVFVAPAIVGATDIAALLPQRIAAESARKHRLKLFEPPYRVHAIEHCMLWLRRDESNPATEWLRSLFRRVSAQLREPRITPVPRRNTSLK